MRVLVACEFSGVVRRMFRERGHDAWSSDLLDAEDGDSHHYKRDCLSLLDQNWDMLIAFPPCTHLSVSGAWKFKEKEQLQRESLEFVRNLLCAPVDKIALENPIGMISTRIRKPDQIIQPWHFGHGEKKTTCLWLKNLPILNPTNIALGEEGMILKYSPGPNRWKDRSRSYSGLAKAMAEQWG